MEKSGKPGQAGSGINSELLFAAAGSGDTAALGFLLDSGADVNCSTNGNITALFAAAYQGEKEVVKQLIKAGADVDKASTESGSTPLWIAAYRDHQEIVQELIKAGADVEKATTDNGFTPLYMAASNGDKDVVEELIKAGADVDKGATYTGITPLLIAADQGHKEMVEELIKAGADVDKAAIEDGSTPLLMAAARGHKGVVEELIKAGADVDKARTDTGCPPLISAACIGHQEVVEELIKAGADVDKTETDEGFTALTIAAFKGHQGIVEELIKAGTDVDTARENDGSTPLLMAADKGHKGVVEELIKAGADVDKARTDNGYTPLVSAACNGHDNLPSELVKAGADISKAIRIANDSGLPVVAAKLRRLLKQHSQKSPGRGHAAANDQSEAARKADQMMAELLAEEESKKGPCSSPSTKGEKPGKNKKSKKKKSSQKKQAAGEWQGHEGQDSGKDSNSPALGDDGNKAEVTENQNEENLSVNPPALQDEAPEALAETLEFVDLCEGSRAAAHHDHPKQQQHGDGKVEKGIVETSSIREPDKANNTVGNEPDAAMHEGGDPLLEPAESGSGSSGQLQPESQQASPRAVKILLDGDLRVYLNEVLGTGCAGTRCLVGWHAGMPVAVKELLRSVTGNDMHREMGILRTVTHRNVVRYYTHASDAFCHYLVLERCECSLEQAVRQSGDVAGGWPGPMVEGAGRMPTLEAMDVAAGMVEGVAELHRLGVVHRDLKPSNILLARDEGGGAVVAKVADLGLGKALGYGQSSFVSARAGGTQCWQAPEQIQTPPDGKYDKRLDVFLLGCLLHFCFTGGQHPFGPFYEQMSNIVHGRTDLSALDHLPMHRALVARMLEKSPEERPKVGAVRRHVLWWRPQEQLGFLCSLSKFIEGRRHLKESLNARAAAVLPGRRQGRWKGELDTALLGALQAPPYGYEYEETVSQLLRAVRNTAEHAHQWGPEAQGVVGRDDGTILEYFCGRFPYFMIGAWEWACGEGDCLESTSLGERLEPAFGYAARQ